MLKLLSTFPNGLPGIGLIFLRLACGSATMLGGVGMLTAAEPLPSGASTIAALTIVTGTALLLGCLTPFAGMLLAILNLAKVVLLLSAAGATPPQRIYDGIHAVLIPAAIALLGPGAFSVDALLFGRREIVIPKGPRTR